jgi:hypothetical protein
MLNDLSSHAFVIIIVSMAMGFALVCVIISSLQSVLRTRQIEQTKRELAAYVAEGSITPEDAMRLAATPYSKKHLAKTTKV